MRSLALMELRITMMKNSEELEGLNEKQKEAALTSADQDVLITAGAGSGKTFTLAKKGLLMISNGYIKPD